MSDLENSLRAALDMAPNESIIPEGAPLALNDDDGLRSIIMGEIHKSHTTAEEATAQRVIDDAVLKAIHTPAPKATAHLTLQQQFNAAVTELNNKGL